MLISADHRRGVQEAVFQYALYRRVASSAGDVDARYDKVGFARDRDDALAYLRDGSVGPSAFVKTEPVAVPR